MVTVDATIDLGGLRCKTIDDVRAWIAECELWGLQDDHILDECVLNIAFGVTELQRDKLREEK